MSHPKPLLLPFGFAATVSLAAYAVIKFLRLEGAIIMMFVTGALLAVYFSLYFLQKFKERTGRIRPVHILGVVLFSAFILATLLRFNYIWGLAGWSLACISALFSGIFIPWLLVLNYQEHRQEFLKNLAGGIGLSVISISLLGFLTRWPLHKELFVLGNALLFLVWLPWHTLAGRKHNGSHDLLFQTLIVAWILLLFVFGVFLEWPVTHWEK